MTPSVSLAATSTPNTPLQPAVPAEYQAGVCNIGPEEIAKRRRGGARRPDHHRRRCSWGWCSRSAADRAARPVPAGGRGGLGLPPGVR